MIKIKHTRRFIFGVSIVLFLASFTPADPAPDQVAPPVSRPHTYKACATVTEIKGARITMCLENGHEYECFCDEFYMVGETLMVTMETNGTSSPYDDEVLKIEEE